ncbi:hypothetical protein O3M35_008919 [Rhynocoris fuscipes]|uniref:Uncharacterized protein n=1 Tax=Rhynocoris fuscipes TaxID=488301 RepID=A0AAW1D805_9HEMI
MPWSINNIWSYTASCIWMLYITYCGLILHLGFCSLHFTVSFQISAYSKILQHHLENSGPQDKSIYLHHQTIIKLVSDYNEISSFIIYVEVLVVSLEACGFGYAMIKGLKRYDPQAIETFYAIMMVLSAIFVTCLCGQEISTQTEKFHESSYMCNWYEEKPKIRKDLLTMMMVTMKPKTLNYRMLAMWNMECFAAVVHYIV